MEVNKEELRRLAEDAEGSFGSFDPSEAEQEFMAEISPAAILSLLDEAEYREDKAARAERNRDMWKAQCEEQAASLDQLRAENERLRERAEKYAVIERVMEMLKCDEREGGIWTACTLLLIGSAHGMNSARSTVDQEGVDIAGENIGDWRVTVERLSVIDKEGNSNP